MKKFLLLGRGFKEIYIIRGKINLKIFITLGEKNSKLINVYIIEGFLNICLSKVYMLKTRIISISKHINLNE